MSPQARGSAGGRRRHDPASQEDHDKPYVCDSKYRRCCLPSPAPAPPHHSLCFPGCQPPASGWLAGPSSGACTPSLHACPSAQSPPPLTPSAPQVSAGGKQAWGLGRGRRSLPTLGAVFLSLGVPYFVPSGSLSLCLLKMHSLFLG